MDSKKLLFFVTEDWYFCSHRLSLAVAAKEAGYEVTVVTRVREHGERIRSAGLRLIPFENARGGVNPLVELITLGKLIRTYWSERPDIVHHVAMKPVFYGSIAARATRVPAVVNAITGMGWLFTSNSGSLRKLIQSLVKPLLGFLLGRGKTIVQNSDDAQFLNRLGVEGSRLATISGSGVDLVEFQPHPRPHAPLTAVLAARLLWDKGVREFVEAARLLKDRGSEARFIVAGEPDPLNRAAVPRHVIDAWVDEGVIEYRGWVEDMSALLAQSHIACLPSYYREGIPKSLLEAAAAGLPIVTTDAPGCREVVTHKENGLLVPPRDAEAVAEALQELLSHPEMREEMGAKGRLRAEREFSIGSVIEQTLSVYRELVE